MKPEIANVNLVAAEAVLAFSRTPHGAGARSVSRAGKEGQPASMRVQKQLRGRQARPEHVPELC